jgi:enterobactin synthetase component F
MFDYLLDIDGIAGQTHTLATGPVNDLELRSSRTKRAG